MAEQLLRLLPGFRVAADRIRQEIKAGGNVVIIRDKYGDHEVTISLIPELETTQEVEQYTENVCDFKNEYDILNFIWTRMTFETAPAGVTVHNLIDSHIGEYTIFSMDIYEHTTAKVWLGFLQQYSQLSSLVDPPRRMKFLLSVPYIILCNPDLISSSQTLTFIGWNSILCGIDARILSQHLTFEDTYGSPLWRSLKANVIASIAGTDIMLAEYLSEIPLFEFDTISSILSEYYSEIEHSLIVESIDMFESYKAYQAADGSKFQHILSYIERIDLEKELSRRIWQAQAETLFPFLENKRWELIKKHKDLWQLPHHRLNNEIVLTESDLEFGDILYQLKHSHAVKSEYQVELVRFFKNIRNALAHFEMISFEKLLSNRHYLEYNNSSE